MYFPYQGQTFTILDDFLFNISENELRITASDLETTMVVSIQPDLVEGAGEVTIPARLLIDILKNFPDIPVSFNIDEAPPRARKCIFSELYM